MPIVRHQLLLGVAAVAMLVAAASLIEPPEEQGRRPISFQQLALDYSRFGRVDEERIRMAPELCRLPPVQPSAARISDSGDSSTHGRKLYYLFARDAEAYRNLDTPQPVGQILVKEAWTAVAMPEGFEPDPIKDLRDKAHNPGEATRLSDGDYLLRGGYMPYVRQDGRWYHPGERAGLFVMMKVGPDVPGTDNGWLYGTVGNDRKVTSQGRVPSCMQCHRQAERDRLFGLPAVAGQDSRIERVSAVR